MTRLYDFLQKVLIRGKGEVLLLLRRPHDDVDIAVACLRNVDVGMLLAQAAR